MNERFSATGAANTSTSAPATEPPAAQAASEPVADAEYKALYVQWHGSDEGWLGMAGSYFISGVHALASTQSPTPVAWSPHQHSPGRWSVARPSTTGGIVEYLEPGAPLMHKRDAQVKADQANAAPTPAAVSEPYKLPIPPAPVDPLEVVYAEGWNACCDAFFGGKPAPEALVITVTAASEPRAPVLTLPDSEIVAILNRSELRDMHHHMGWYSAPEKAFKRHGLALAREIERAILAAAPTATGGAT